MREAELCIRGIDGALWHAANLTKFRGTRVLTSTIQVSRTLAIPSTSYFLRWALRGALLTVVEVLSRYCGPHLLPWSVQTVVAATNLPVRRHMR